MTYPVDDKGNPRVDFVWGPFPIQPNDQRTWTGNGSQITTDGNWTVSKEVGSQSLASGWDVLNFGTGDGGNYRQQTFTWDNHEIATTGYSNYPQFIANYAGDGDTGLEAVVPNIEGLTESAAQARLANAGFNTSNADGTLPGTLANDGTVHQLTTGIKNPTDVIHYQVYTAPTVPNLVGLVDPETAQAALTAAGLVLGNTDPSTDGATSGNNLHVKSQSIAAGTKVNPGTVVNIVVYNYVVTTHPVAGFSTNSFPGHAACAGGEIYMFLLGRTTKPTAGATITTAGNSNTSLNRNWTVNTVEDNDSYNSGGTVCKLTALTGGVLANPNTNATVGTWVLA